MSIALTYALFFALLLAAPVRAVRPGGLLAALLPAWQWWLVMRPAWLPAAVTGGCAACTAFWWLGAPVAVAAGFSGAGWWALGCPFLVAVVFELAVSK